MKRSQLLALSSEMLLKNCVQDFFIGSGKGGQHRNKTETGVRLTLKESAWSVYDNSSRYREENRQHALRKMRMLLAFHLRETPIPEIFPAPSVKHALWPAWVGIFLDHFEKCAFKISDTARQFQTTTAPMLKILRKDPEVWQHVMQLQREHGNTASDTEHIKEETSSNSD